MSLPYLLGFGSLGIEEMRPRSANEPRVKRLYFTKNRRHVTDDRGRGRRRIGGDDWAMVPYNASQRRQNQIDEWDRKKAAAQLRWDEEDFRHQEVLNQQRLRLDEELHRRRVLGARQLNDIILQGQRIPPQYVQQMQEMQHQQRMMQGHGGYHQQDHGEQHQLHGDGGHHQLPPGPPDHRRPGSRGGHGDHRGQDPRIVPIGPGGGGHEDSNGEEESDEPERGGHHRHHRRGRQPNRRRRDNFGHGGNHGHRFEHGEDDDDIVVIESSESEDDNRRRRSPQRIGGGHGQRLPSVFRHRPRSQSRAHRSHSRPRNYSRIGWSRGPSRRRHIYPSDDSESDSDYEHVRFIRPRLRPRGSLRRGRGGSRHYEDYSSDDSFTRPRFRLRSMSRHRPHIQIIRR